MRLAAIVFCCAFAVLAVAAPPGLSLRDAGELTTAAYGLGVAHETGFTLFCLLGKAATLLPLGDVALRVALLSAASAALAAALACVLVRRLVAEAVGTSTGAVGGVAAAVVLVGAATFFRSAATVEVYAPTAAALVGLLLCVDVARTPAGARWAGPLAALVGGLSLGLHGELRLLLAPPLLVWGLLRFARGERWPLRAPLALALGALVALYLPLRAAAHPYADWAAPETLRDVLAHLGAARIRRAFADEMFPVAAVWRDHLTTYARQLEAQLGIPTLFAAVAGGWLLVRRRRTRTVGILVALVLVGDAAYATALNPMGLGDLQDGTPALVALALFAGVAVAHGGARAGRAAPFAAALLAVVVAAPTALAQLPWKRHLDREPARVVAQALADAGPRALVLVTSDDLAAGIGYAQAVEGARPDVTALVRQQLWDAALVEARARRAGGVVDVGFRGRRWSSYSEPERIRLDGEYARALVARTLASQGELLWELGADVPPVPPTQIEPGLPLARLRAAAVGVGVDPAPASSLVARADALLTPGDDPLVRRVGATWLSNLGRLALARDRVDDARALFERALVWRPGDGAAATNLGVLRARAGDFAGAAALVEEALAHEPGRLVARVNAGRYRLALGDAVAAERHFRAARARAPHDAAPVVGLARVAIARGDRAAARALLETAQRLDAHHPEVRALATELK